MSKQAATASLNEITVAHSPDSDDAFMFYGLAKNLIDTGGLTVNQVMSDIESLNKEALTGRYEVSAISFAAYPQIADQYMIMSCGASMGDKYGPVLVARKDLDRDELAKAVTAIPGKMTSAYLTLRLYWHSDQSLGGEPIVTEEPFDRIIEAVVDGKYDAGLLIHEGQLTYEKVGLKKIVDLGQWWHEQTALPLPLGGNAIRKDLGPEKITTICALLKESIKYSLANRKEALQYAMGFSRDMPEELSDRFVEMYVNDLTVDMGDRGRQAVCKMFELANQRGLFDKPVRPEFVD